jgi:hypothetical protein
MRLLEELRQLDITLARVMKCFQLSPAFLLVRVENNQDSQKQQRWNCWGVVFIALERRLGRNRRILGVRVL